MKKGRQVTEYRGRLFNSFVDCRIEDLDKRFSKAEQLFRNVAKKLRSKSKKIVL